MGNKETQVVDVVILGAGGGGYPAAFLLAKSGLRVVMVDPIGNLGGNCLAEGCIPSKTVREASLARASANKYALFGLKGQLPEVDWRGVLAHKDRVQQIRYQQHRHEIESSGVRFHNGTGRITGEHEVEVTDRDGTSYYAFRDLIIATGSRSHILNIPGAELSITSHDLFRLGADIAFPQRLVVIGGGYIGVESASMFNNFGAQATVLEYMDQLLPGVDKDLADALYTRLSARMRIELKAEVTAIEKDDLGLKVQYRQNGQIFSVIGDAVLMASGRECVLPEGIQALGLNEHGFIPVNNCLQTSTPHVYATGDVNGRSMLFHSAVGQSLVAAHNILAGGQASRRIDFGSVPFTVFTEPEIAWVGLNEEQARKKYADVEVRRYNYQYDTRAQIFGEMEGFIKLVFDGQTSCLLGAQIAGIDAAQLIAPLALAVSRHLDAHALTNVIFPHPMISEGINNAARSFQP